MQGLRINADEMGIWVEITGERLPILNCASCATAGHVGRLYPSRATTEAGHAAGANGSTFARLRQSVEAPCATARTAATPATG